LFFDQQWLSANLLLVKDFSFDQALTLIRILGVRSDFLASDAKMMSKTQKNP
jgi:hypothetical protein